MKNLHAASLERTALLHSAALAMFIVGLLLLAPTGTRAAVSPNASLGGGNALTRATEGRSQGLTSANTTSGLLEHLTSASTRGGRPVETPPQNEEGGGTGSTNANENAGDNSNGGASGGSGGGGGSAAPGGSVRAGSSVSNATAVNVINTVIVRVGH